MQSFGDSDVDSSKMVCASDENDENIVDIKSAGLQEFSTEKSTRQ